MKIYALLISLFLPNLYFSQSLEKVILGESDPYHFYINDGDSTQLYYYKLVPKNKPIGVLIIFPSGGETIENLLKQITLHKKAYNHDILVIIPSYNWGTFQKIPDILFLDTIFEQVVNQHKLAKDNFVFCGLSNGAMVSLSYGVNSIRDSNTFVVPKGIIGLDPPLDLMRFYKYCEREVERNFSPAGVGEANFLLNSYKKIYGELSTYNREPYIHGSIYSHGIKDGGNAKYLNSIAIQMYSDLDLNYLLNERQRDLYDWNGIDVVAFINQLKINGNNNAEVIISQNKGIRLNGEKHPHSWSIMDTDKTMQWILELIKK